MCEFPSTMPPPTKKSRANKTSDESVEETRKSTVLIPQTGSTILSLPDEMLQLVFSNLSTEERVPLGMTCRRFRNADFELAGRTFSKIQLKWRLDNYKDAIFIQTMFGRTATTKYGIMNYKCYPIQATPHNLRLFRRAKTDFLEISYENHDDETKDDFAFIHKLTKPISYDKLFCWCYSESSEILIRYLMRGRDLANAQICIILSRRNSNGGISKTKQLLMELPLMNSFKLDWVPLNAVENNLLDDETLLHITSSTNHAELCHGAFTTDGILNAFKLVRSSPLDHKYVAFSLDSTTIDDLFARDDHPFDIESEDDKWFLVDSERRNVLIATESYIQMCKMNEEEHCMYNEVLW